MAEGETSDRVEFDRGASITWTRGPLDHHQAHVLYLERYNDCDEVARIASRPSDRDPRGAILSIL